LLLGGTFIYATIEVVKTLVEMSMAGDAAPGRWSMAGNS
jgi:hypothetical protein